MPSLDVENVLLVVVDTLRARNVGCYGGSYDVSPTIDGLAADGVVVEDAVCTQSGSWVSYTTMFRGDHAFGFSLTDTAEHHRQVNEETQYKTAYRNTPDDHCVPPLLQAAGIETRAVVSGSMLDRSWGWDCGFDQYEDSLHGSTRRAALRSKPSTMTYRALSKLDRARFPPFGSRRAERTAKLARRELVGLSDEDGWFLFLQFTDPHAPLATYEDTPDDWHPYDQEIRRADDAIATVYDELEQLGLCDSTLVVLTADHGESLGERGVTGHGKHVYDESIRVPLIFSHPDLPARRHDEGVARLKDIGPTILDALDQDVPAGYTGESLLPALAGGGDLAGTAFVFANGQFMVNEALNREVPMSEAGAVAGIRTATGKYIRSLSHDIEWFFDLSTDPRERRNRSESAPIDRYRDRLTDRLDDWENRQETVAGGEAWRAERKMEEQLRDLGYM